MKTRFLHCADIHLGYQQYNQKERLNDFHRALLAVVEQAIAEKVDFVILAGDLFQKRAIDALTLNQAMYALRLLKSAGIPCIAVEGNHERAYYEETLGWMKFLALQDLLILLDAEFSDGKPQLQPWDARRRQGSYVEPVPGLRVHGLRYYGSGTATAMQAYAEALAVLPSHGIAYTIFVAHAGVEGQMDDKAGGLSNRQWAVLHPHVDYLALGHFHMPFQLENWIYNPGSPENCSIAETEWKSRGYLLVDVDTERPSSPDDLKHTVVQGNTPRRACRLYSFRTDLLSTPDLLMARLREFLQRRAIELRDEVNHSAGREFLPPVVELYLTGVLPFDRSGLDIAAIRDLLDEAFHPLVAMVKNLTQNADYAVDVGATLTRAELERQVLASLFARDQRYAGQNEAWAALALSLKQLALSEASPAAILDELGAQMERVGAE